MLIKFENAFDIREMTSVVQGRPEKGTAFEKSWGRGCIGLVEQRKWQTISHVSHKMQCLNVQQEQQNSAQRMISVI